MFDIEYKGANTVKVITKQGTLVADPKLSLAGLKDADVTGAVVLLTESRFGVDKSDAARIVLEGPGEYGVAGFDIKGIAAQRHIDSPELPLASTAYRIEVGDVRIALLGNIDSKLSEDQLEDIGVVDIAILPIGGNGYTLDGVSAAKLVRQVDPKVVIPVHYQDAKLAYEVPQDTLDVFLHEIGAPVETVAKYKVKQASQLPSVLTVIVVERS